MPQGESVKISFYEKGELGERFTKLLVITKGGGGGGKRENAKNTGVRRRESKQGRRSRETP